MKITWKQSIASVTLSVALLTAATPVWASDTAALIAAPIVSYALTDSIDVEIKSLLNEHTGDGTQLGAVVRIKNTTSKVTRVPEYELRVRTVEGTEYTLKPSVKNAASIQPKAQLELSYLSVIDRTDDIQLSAIAWVDVDWYVYPKKETEVLALPIDSLSSWRGSGTVITDQAALKKWGEAFGLPSFRSSIEYRTVDIHREVTDKGPQSVVQIEATNPTDERLTIPVFTIDGTTDGRVFSGTRAEDSVLLEPGEKEYLHFLIPTDLDTELTGLNIVTPEKFATGTEEKNYNVGRLRILLPASETGSGSTLPKYEFGKPLQLDPLNKRIHSSMEVSLVELNLHENDTDGFKTAVAKYKLTNHSDRPLPVPQFQTALSSADGYEYTGSRQAATAQRIVPNASYTVSYSFALPASEEGAGLKLSLYDQQASATASYKSLLAAYTVDVQPEEETSVVTRQFKVYPFDVLLSDWRISANLSPMGAYSYKIKLFMRIEQDKQVITDANSSKLEIGLYDNLGKLLGSSTVGFTGQNRLLNGENIINTNATSDQLEVPLTIKIYEVFTNENGEVAKRFLTSFKS